MTLGKGSLGTGPRVAAGGETQGPARAVSLHRHISLAMKFAVTTVKLKRAMAFGTLPSPP